MGVMSYMYNIFYVLVCYIILRKNNKSYIFIITIIVFACNNNN
jgi:hypothetical protein